MASWLVAHKLLARNALRSLYPNGLSILAHVFTELGTLFLYWYTAKALAPRVEFQEHMGNDYFSFIILGELALLIPSTMLYNFTRTIRQLHQSNTLEYLAVQPYSKYKLVVGMGAAIIWIKLIHILLTMAVLVAFFALKISWLQMICYLLLILAAIPVFIGLGLMSAAIVLWWGRGERVITMIANGSYLVAGVYFPTQVFPETFANVVNIISPFNILINGIRQSTQSSGALQLPWGELGVLVLLGLGFFIAGAWLLERAFVASHRRHRPLLFY